VPKLPKNLDALPTADLIDMLAAMEREQRVPLAHRILPGLPFGTLTLVRRAPDGGVESMDIPVQGWPVPAPTDGFRC
jgi:hypothetical protein